VLALLLVAAPGCAIGISAGLPVYRQGLIDPEWDPISGSEPAPAATETRRRLARCRRVEGRELASALREAERQLLARCWGRFSTPPQVSPERAPRPLDLVRFEEARPSAAAPAGALLGVVLAVQGDRVEFLYPRGTRARRGFLNLRHPDRRRSAPGRIDNTYLRVIRPGDPRGTRYLAGQLLAGFAAPWK
jgi:hypothetical protein